MALPALDICHRYETVSQRVYVSIWCFVSLLWCSKDYPHHRVYQHVHSFYSLRILWLMDLGSSAFPHGKVTLFYLSVHTLMDSGRSPLSATVNNMALTTQRKVASVVSISLEHLPEDLPQNRSLLTFGETWKWFPRAAAVFLHPCPQRGRFPTPPFFISAHYLSPIPSTSLCAKWRRSVLLSCICFAKLLCLFWVLCISIWILESTCRFLPARRIIGILIKVVLNWHIDELEECRHSNNARAQTL